MKKFVTVILSVLLVFIFCSCGNSENNNTVLPENTDYDLKSVFDTGSLPDTKYKLGTDPETIKTDCHYGEAEDEEHDHENELSITERDDYVRMSYIYASYYYKAAAAQKGISSVVSFDDMFGLSVGSSSMQDVKDAFKDYTFEQEQLTNKDTYYLPRSIESTVALSITQNGKKISFVFSEDALVAINLTDTANWK